MKILPVTHRNSPRKWPILPVLLGLDAFVTGGLVALLTVNRLLQKAANAYAPSNMDAASTVLDLMDKLLANLFPCSVLLLFLVLITIAVGVWLKAKSRTVRYAVTALVLVALLLSAAGIGIWALKASEMPSVLPMTPTPTPAQEISFRSQAPIAETSATPWLENGAKFGLGTDGGQHRLDRNKSISCHVRLWFTLAVESTHKHQTEMKFEQFDWASASRHWSRTGRSWTCGTRTGAPAASGRTRTSPSSNRGYGVLINHPERGSLEVASEKVKRVAGSTAQPDALGTRPVPAQDVRRLAVHLQATGFPC